MLRTDCESPRMKTWNYAPDICPAWKPIAVRGKYAHRHQVRRLVNAGWTLARLNRRWFAHSPEVHSAGGGR